MVFILGRSVVSGKRGSRTDRLIQGQYVSGDLDKKQSSSKSLCNCISVPYTCVYLHVQANCNLPVSSKNKLTSYRIKIIPRERFPPEQERGELYKLLIAEVSNCICFYQQIFKLQEKKMFVSVHCHVVLCIYLLKICHGGRKLLYISNLF